MGLMSKAAKDIATVTKTEASASNRPGQMRRPNLPRRIGSHFVPGKQPIALYAPIHPLPGILLRLRAHEPLGIIFVGVSVYRGIAAHFPDIGDARAALWDVAAIMHVALCGCMG